MYMYITCHINKYYVMLCYVPRLCRGGNLIMKVQFDFPKYDDWRFNYKRGNIFPLKSTSLQLGATADMQIQSLRCMVKKMKPFLLTCNLYVAKSLPHVHQECQRDLWTLAEPLVPSHLHIFDFRRERNDWPANIACQLCHLSLSLWIVLFYIEESGIMYNCAIWWDSSGRENMFAF